MNYDIVKIRSGSNTGKFYARNENEEVTPLFNIEEELETAIFKRNVKWVNLDD